MSMHEDVLSAASSYSYEATFAAGSIGINLQATRSGFGTFDNIYNVKFCLIIV